MVSTYTINTSLSCLSKQSPIFINFQQDPSNSMSQNTKQRTSKHIIDRRKNYNFCRRKTHQIETIQALRTSTKTLKSITIFLLTQAILLQPPHISISNKFSTFCNRKCIRTVKRMQPNSTITIYQITTLIWFYKLNSSHFQSLFQTIHTCF